MFQVLQKLLAFENPPNMHYKYANYTEMTIFIQQINFSLSKYIKFPYEAQYLFNGL